MAEHPSAHVKSFYDSVVTYLDVIANPPEPLKAFSGKAADSIAQLSNAFKPFKYGHSVASVPPNQRLGFWIALGTVANPAHFQPVAVFKQITSAAKALAYDKWNKLPTMVRKFLSAVQGSGSANQPYRDGKLTDHQGQNCRAVLTNLYEHASSTKKASRSTSGSTCRSRWCSRSCISRRGWSSRIPVRCAARARRRARRASATTASSSTTPRARRPWTPSARASSRASRRLRLCRGALHGSLA
jgi:hypothetical protein